MMRISCPCIALTDIYRHPHDRNCLPTISSHLTHPSAAGPFATSAFRFASPIRPFDHIPILLIYQPHSPPLALLSTSPHTSMKLFHRKTEAWEVVDQKVVDPVPVFSRDERESMDIVETCDETMCGVYRFELKGATNLARAVIFAQQRLLQEAGTKGYNVFLTEGWSVTYLRMGKQQRAEVRYTGQPAYTSTKPKPHMPPFLAILDPRGTA
ncbi:hypothetical protein C8Q80DRAFT_84891 [Daedaleopsis nitida]|nr:hypothetical protein C8Q80DRAFT_84891 [Daedaleopsis nitida]